MNWMECGRKQSQLNLRENPRRYLKGGRRKIKTLSQDSQSWLIFRLGTSTVQVRSISTCLVRESGDLEIEHKVNRTVHKRK